MLLGFNYPWSRFADGAQIGPQIWGDAVLLEKWNQLARNGKLSKTDIPLPPLFDYLDRNLKNLANMGISVVRWFLLGNGNNYGPNPRKVIESVPPKLNDLPNPKRTIYRFDPPPGADPRFKRDFAEMLEVFKVNKMQLIPSLINFEFGGEAITGPGPNGTWHAGRADVIRDPVKRTLFLKTMLGDLLDASKGYESVIYAWEVMNEPIHLALAFGILSRPNWMPRPQEVTRQDLKDFLQEAVARINLAGLPSTIGHRFYDDMTEFASGETVRQFHYYANERFYNSLGGANGDPPMKGLFKGSNKAFLGEFSAVGGRPEKWTYSTPQTDSTLNRLKLLEAEGCDLALIWPDVDLQDSDPPEKKDHYFTKDGLALSDEARAAIVAFTGRTLPPANE